jgi:hypothetical protein
MSLPSLSFAPLLESPPKLVYGVLLALLIVYSSVVPDGVRLFADTLLGRLFGILWIYLTVEGLGWLFGLFTALAFLMVIYLSPRDPHSPFTEGFHGGGGGVVEKERIGKRWFVERVLGEHPVAISTEKVTTLPVQD